MAYRFIDHTGDTGIELTAADEIELFAEATRALCSVYVDTARTPPRCDARQEVELEAEDVEALLVDYLNELIFRFDTGGFLPWELDVAALDPGPPARLRAVVRGDVFDARRHAFLTEVKAATFHGVEIRRRPDSISVTVVLDL